MRLETFDWPSSPGLSVSVGCGTEQIEARQVGFGNVEGYATIELDLVGDWDVKAASLRALVETKKRMQLTTAH